jgi:hypothetical protein
MISLHRDDVDDLAVLEMNSLQFFLAVYFIGGVATTVFAGATITAVTQQSGQSELALGVIAAGFIAIAVWFLNEFVAVLVEVTRRYCDSHGI